MLNRRISIAPMMDCTDRHYRYLIRLMTRQTLLYTEMLTANAVIHGDREYLLGYSPEEHPLAMQLGGSDPAQLAEAARICEDLGYDEINLNVGCPSDRVQAGRFGACLMKEPNLVAECVLAMQKAVNLPVTVKTRLGVDEFDSYDFLLNFIETVAATGCKTFILHARKAWLKGLSPRENREVPPLLYDRVYQLKRDYPELEIIINGGIKTHEASREHLEQVDGVMLGREAYSNPYWFARVDQDYFAATEAVLTQREVIQAYVPYIIRELEKGVPVRALTRVLIGFFQGLPGARVWRRSLSENAHKGAGVEIVQEALLSFQSSLQA